MPGVKRTQLANGARHWARGLRHPPVQASFVFLVCWEQNSSTEKNSQARKGTGSIIASGEEGESSLGGSFSTATSVHISWDLGRGFLQKPSRLNPSISWLSLSELNRCGGGARSWRLGVVVYGGVGAVYVWCAGMWNVRGMCVCVCRVYVCIMCM